MGNGYTAFNCGKSSEYKYKVDVYVEIRIW